MKKWLFRTACLLAFAFSPAAFVAPPAQAVVATTKYTLTASAWTDLGVGPVLVSTTGRVVFAVADTTPSLVSEGFAILPGASFTFNTASHVWARSVDGISPFVYASPILASGGSSGGGAITAGTTATSGFAAGQLILSDGSVVKPSTFGLNSGGGGVSTPLTMAGTYDGAVFLYSGLPALTLSNFGQTMVSMPYNTGLAWWDNIDYDGSGPANHLQLGLFAAQAGIYGILEQRPVASIFATQAYHIYNAWTDDNNGEWGTLDWKTTANVLTIGTQKNGTGTLRPMNLVASGLQMNGTAGVTCSGAPTASFATVNGIVTHC